MSDFDIFEYAGVSSSVYNLVSCEIKKDYQNLISGAEYKPTVDNLPHSANQLLLGFDYSGKPLEFDLEIINPDENIPFSQVEEIKDWLFGQNGWKKFVLINEKQDYYLRALLIPSEDIMDVNGYRGFRCKIRNDSGFWYRDEDIDIPLVYSQTSGYSAIIKTINLKYLPDRMEINPKIKFSTYASSIKKTTTIEAAENGQLSITDNDGIPHSITVATDNGYQNTIVGSYSNSTNTFTATTESDIVSGTTYYVRYWIKQDENGTNYWKDGRAFSLTLINMLNDSVMAFDGVQSQFSIEADCKYGKYKFTQNGIEATYNLKYPPFIDGSTKYSNLFYLSRGVNKFKIFMKIWTEGNATYANNITNGVVVGNKLTISFTSLHRIGGF